MSHLNATRISLRSTGEAAVVENVGNGDVRISLHPNVHKKSASATQDTQVVTDDEFEKLV